MASYHFSAQIVKRSAGRSVVAMAAYRAGERLYDDKAGRWADFGNRRGVVHREILAPEGSAPWLTDRSTLWNAVEHGEKRRDAQLAREINIALPYELSHAQRVELLRAFVQEQFVGRGMVADVAVHEPVPEKGDNPRNHHAHILLTLRQATATGLRSVKTREWNSDRLMLDWRAAWAAHQNDALRRGGHRTSVDHRSLYAQRAEAQERGDLRTAARFDRAPEIHVGPSARLLASQGRSGRSRPVEVGPKRRREEGKAPTRRVRDYPRHDRGSRLDWLTNLLLGNNQLAKARVEKFERQSARLQRKLDYWERQARFHIDGAIQGRLFRWERVKAADLEKARRQKERDRQVQAAKRATQLREIIAELEKVLAAFRGGREAVLARSRQLEGWRRRLDRELDRARSAERGRTR
ncbi:MobQ family relaxase [Xanthobacter wiegelii]|uniref:MobQ family relaxase n=1 Tax=Xanthobacter wiegelii TaxID=3119913 RepID=UPI00372BE733